jgi:HNH endonuclease
MSKYPSNSFVPRDRVKALGFATYTDYLKSDHWRELRQKFFRSKLVKRDKNGKIRCEACQSTDKRFNVHHRTYKRIGAERLIDLAILCEDCHERAHEMHRANPRDGLWRATKMVKREQKRLMRHTK